jgi:cytochrome bd-type quinol oxidase subunit 2
MNIKIIDKKYKVDTIPILRSKWIDLTKSVERIAKEDRWIWFLFVGGLFLGILIMAAFGVYYSGSGFENKNDAYIIYKKDVKNFNKIGFNKTCILFKKYVFSWPGLTSASESY